METANPDQKTTKRTEIDWEAVEIQYRAGIRSLKDIGKEFGVSDAGILKRAKKFDWSRDLAAKIKAKAEAKVSAAAVSELVSAGKVANENAVVEANATNMANVQLAQRKDIARTRGLFQKLLEELEQTTENRELFEALGELMQAQAESAAAEKLNQIYRKVIGLQGRITSGKELTLMLEKVVGMERQAYGMDKEQPKTTDGLTTLLQTITSGTTSTFKPVARDPEHDEDD